LINNLFIITDNIDNNTATNTSSAGDASGNP